MRPTALGVLRAVAVVVAALLTATVLPRYGVPARWTPDLVLVIVVSTAVLRGPVHGALVGLAAGWFVDLLPPVGSPLGAGPLVSAAAGAAAGALVSRGSRSWLRPVAALAVASITTLVARWVVSTLRGGSVLVTDGLSSSLTSLGVGIVVLPVLIALDRALVRRRLG